MSRLFASHLLQPATSLSLSGHYDQEQELWVGDNQLHGGIAPTQTQPSTGSWWEGVTYIWTGTCYTTEDDYEWEPDPDDAD
jgi:hypothetical protein